MPYDLDVQLAGVHPTLATHARAIIAAMKALGFRMIVTDGLRTTKQQQALYAKGRTVPGAIVTQVDGVRVRSNHQARENGRPFAGYGAAVDMAFLDSTGAATWSEHMPWLLYGRMATALGLKWGGDWPRFKDRPHIELP